MTEVSSDDVRTSIPQVVGRYRITDYLGRGGMGVVVRGHDAELQRSVALKLLHLSGAGALARIEIEALAMAKVSHPNVVTIYEVGREEEGAAYIAMELVTGGTLRDWLRREDRPWRKTLSILIAAGRGLAAAHAAGLVHRDFKPENVLVGNDERPRVTDFGVVAPTPIAMEVIEASEGCSVASGTPEYMAPEQWAGADADARADQFAFAVTCWEALWGSRPFASRDNVHTEPARLASRRGVPRRIETALRTALATDREERWSTLAGLLDRLEQSARDRRPIAAAVAAVAALVASGATLMWSRATDERSRVCLAAGDDVQSVWSSERQRELAEAFTSQPEAFASDTWADLKHSVEDWEADYRAQRVQTCQLRRSGGTAGAEFATARESCLSRRREELSALLDGLARPDATTLRYARAAARGLTRPSACLGAQTDAPTAAQAPLAARDALSDMRRKLAEASTLRALGKPLEAVALAVEVAKKADALEWAPLIAESQLELGLAYQAANANADGEKAHARAALFADAAQDDEIRFAAMLGLADAGMDHSQYDESAKAIESARMIARRLPPDERRDVTLELNESLLAFWRGDYDPCVSRGQETLGRIARILGRNAVEGIILREKVVHCYAKAGKYQESEAMLREGLAIADASIGREHPVAADLVFALAYHAVNSGNSDEGLRLFQEALAIRERTLGPANPIVGLSHTGIGQVLWGAGRFAEAREHLERAAAIIEPTWGSDSPALAIAELLLGEVAMELAEYDVAERHYRRALAIYVVKRPPGHDELLGAKARVGRALLAKGDRAAIALLQEATDGLDVSASAGSIDAALNRAYLGSAYVTFGERQRGLVHIMKACAVIDQIPGLTESTRECAPYVAKQPKPKAPAPPLQP